MLNKRKGLLGATTAAVVLGSVLLWAGPAQAATASGTRLCTSPRTPALQIDSSKSGNGTWTNYDTAANTPFTFPGGNSWRYSPYFRANWLVTNGSTGTFYSSPSASCVV
ncbi:hypothetical protein [uncultured Microbacterium sp.]|uniref:hypothetical protein n=1 Tax=uncultured Microbacterium sp. TaxID=191216 RepID=UPI002602BDB2|nr:hypothetical protein [uncultured Microbacterium sp.]